MFKQLSKEAYMSQIASPVEERQEVTQSPALQAMMAVLTMPYQYATIMAAAVESVNEQCPLTVRRIEK